MVTDARAIQILETPQDLGIQAVVNVPQALERIKQLQEFIGKVMVKGEDYGVIPGTGGKPTLLKPGAEKLCEMYGLVPTLETEDKLVEWQDPFFYYQVKCSLVSKRTGGVVAEGVGSCNSRERRYRNQDTYTIANTVLKMAKKRAVVDATLSATRSSGLFTQDLEDDAETDKPAPPKPTEMAKSKGAPSSEPHEAKYTRAQLEKRYKNLLDTADALEVPGEHYQPKWTDAELEAKGRALRDAVTAKESQLDTYGVEEEHAAVSR